MRGGRSFLAGSCSFLPGVSLLFLLGVFLLGCDDKSTRADGESSESAEPNADDSDDGKAKSKEIKRPPLSAIEVEHGALDTHPPDGATQLVSTVIAATVYKLPNEKSRRLGYVRLGGAVARDPDPVSGRGCKGKWYRVYPVGFMCTDEASTDLEAPLVRAAAVRPNLKKPLPYAYGFVRATAPQYLRMPTKHEQVKSEFKLLEHIDWFHEHKAEVQTVVLGANDVALDERGVAVPELKHAPGYKPATELSRGELFGASGADDAPPFWLLPEGERKIPNVSGFKVPDYAVFADRVRRHTGLSFVGSFNTKSDDLERSFGITVDLRLIPTTKVKPDTGSAFHGIEIPKEMHFPFAFVIKKDTSLYKLVKGQDASRPAEAAPHRAIVPLSGKARIKEGRRFYQTLGNKERWLKDTDIGIVHKPQAWPEPAEKNQKWIDISIGQQVLTLYDGRTPRYATLISTGRDRFGDPAKDLTTPLGDFRIQSKHIAAAMDSEENSTVSGGTKSRAPHMDAEGQATTARLKKMKAAGKTLSEMDQRRWANIEKGRHPEYGVTRRRGSTAFELRDVPWIQYFSSGFALHGAYWHDVFGIPRSHGCVNLSPIDARIVFNWTDPPVPDGWHGLNVGDETGPGTWVHIRK